MAKPRKERARGMDVLTFRAPRDQRQLIRRAARLVGLPASTYVREVVVLDAQRKIDANAAARAEAANRLPADAPEAA